MSNLMRVFERIIELTELNGIPPENSDEYSRSYVKDGSDVGCMTTGGVKSC